MIPSLSLALDLFPVVTIFFALAYACWRNNAPEFAYMMAWFLGVGNLAFMIGNGLGKEVLVGWALIAGLAFVGFLRERISQK